MMARPPKAGRSLLQGHRNRYGDTPAAEGWGGLLGGRARPYTGTASSAPGNAATAHRWRR